MSPNLYVLAKNICQPQSWFREKQPPKNLNVIRYHKDPLPGLYQHSPSRGWLLIATKSDPMSAVCDVKVEPPRLVIYSQVLKRFLFETEFRERCRQGRIKGHPHWQNASKFFRLDDGITWVNCYDYDGDFLPGPWQRFCYDNEKEKFRPMLKGDGKYGDNELWLARRKEGKKSSRPSSRAASSQANSMVAMEEFRSRSNCTSPSESRVHSRAVSIASTTQIDKEGYVVVGTRSITRNSSEVGLTDTTPRKHEASAHEP